MKVMTILGTRPEIIRLSCVMARLEATSTIDHVLVHTGQNYDYELNGVFFDELGVRKPDHFLNVDTTSLGTVYGGVLVGAERVLLEERPDAVLILGDTNSAISAIIAKRLHIPVFHMEAGNRSFDWRVPEEVNRHIVDSIADINMVYTEHARRNLLAEGLPANRVYLTGSPMAEVLGQYEQQIDASNALVEEELEPRKYFLVSLHREENVDDLATLTELLESIESLASVHGIPALVSLHPRTDRRLREFGIDAGEFASLRMQKPYGFFAYNKLQKNALCVISDSGTLSEESSILGFAGVTPRRSMERPEGLDAGTIILAGTKPADVIAAVQFSIDRDMSEVTVPREYLVRDCSNRVLSLLLSRPLPGGI